MNRSILFLAVFCWVGLVGCGAPIFRSHEERFGDEPEVLTQVEPYLARWATTPANDTKDERQEIESQNDGVVWITITAAQTVDNEFVTVVDIGLSGWGDWTKGYYYVHDGSELVEGNGLKLRRIDEHLYIYNRNW